MEIDPESYLNFSTSKGGWGPDHRDARLHELKLMRGLVELMMMDHQGHPVVDEHGSRLLQSLNGTIELYENNGGDYNMWPLHERIRLYAWALGDTDMYPDVHLAADVLRDYATMIKGSGEIDDDRLGPMLSSFNQNGEVN